MLRAKETSYFEVNRSKNGNIKGKEIASWNKASLCDLCICKHHSRHFTVKELTGRRRRAIP